MIEEIPHVFGDDARLVGVCTRPLTGAAPVGVVLVNAGVIHRIGPHRSAVKLARVLASAGITVLRFDLSGVGDSRQATGGRTYHEQSVHDIRDAMDLLRDQHQIRRVVLYGICSGAVHACAAAIVDDRVVGLAMMDGYAFPTWKTPIATALAMGRTLPPGALARKALRQLGRLAGGARGPQAGTAVPAGVAADPDAPPTVMPETALADAGAGLPAPGATMDRAAFRRVMQHLIARGVHVYLLYSGSIREAFSYAEQMHDTYGRNSFLRHVRLDFFPEIDHTLTTLDGQRTIERAVRQWVQQAVLGHGDAMQPAGDADTRPAAYFNDREHGA